MISTSSSIFVILYFLYCSTEGGIVMKCDTFVRPTSLVYPEVNIAYGLVLNSINKSFNALIGTYLYDSCGIRCPKIPEYHGTMKVFYSLDYVTGTPPEMSESLT